MIEYGADTNGKGKNGKTAVDIAIEKGRLDWKQKVKEFFDKKSRIDKHFSVIHPGVDSYIIDILKRGIQEKKIEKEVTQKMEENDTKTSI